LPENGQSSPFQLPWKADLTLFIFNGLTARAELVRFAFARPAPFLSRFVDDLRLGGGAMLHSLPDAAHLDEDQAAHGAYQAAKHNQNWVHFCGLPSRRLQLAAPGNTIPLNKITGRCGEQFPRPRGPGTALQIREK
jgi:hypothetical protein